MFTSASLVVLGRIATIAIQLGSAIVLARLLTPSEFGVFSVGAAAVGLLQGFREFGAANYIVRAESADRRTVGCALTVSASFSFGLGIVIWFAAEPLANLYDKDGVAIIVRILALNFVLSPALMMGMALLTRSERFGTRVAVEVLAALIGAIVSVGLAASNFGPISLALGTTANSVTAFAAYLYIRPAGFSLVPSSHGVSKAFKFGGWLSGINVASQLAERGTELLLGKTLGFAAVGYFDKGWATVRIVNSFFNSVLHSVVFAAAARERREGADGRKLYLARLTVLTGVLWPMLGFLFVFADGTVLLLFGDQWRPAVPIAQGAAVAAMVLVPITLGDQLLIIGGDERVVFRYKIRYAVGKLLVVLLAAPLGLPGVAYSLAVASAYQAWMQRIAIERNMELEDGWWKRSLGPSFRLTLFLVAVMWVVRASFPGSGEGVMELIAGALAAAGAWVLGTSFERSQLTGLRDDVFTGIGRLGGVIFERCRERGKV